MIMIKASRYTAEEASKLHELFISSKNRLLHEVCSNGTEMRCDSCPFRVLCEDLDRTIDYLDNFEPKIKSHRNTK